MKKFNKMLAVLLSLVLCAGMVAPGFAASFTDLQNAIDNSTGGTKIDGTDYYGYGENKENEAGKGYDIWAKDDGGTRDVQLKGDVAVAEPEPEPAPAPETDEDSPAGDETGEEPAVEPEAEPATGVVIDGGKTVVIDLNGNNITGNGEDDVITVERGATLTVNGTDADPEAGAPKNTITGDVENTGTLTVNKATIDGDVTNNRTFTLTDSVVTGNVTNRPDEGQYRSWFNKNNSTVEGLMSWTFWDTEWHLESADGSDGYRVVIGADADSDPKTTFGSGFSGEIEDDAKRVGISTDQITEIEFGPGMDNIDLYWLKDFPNLTSLTIIGGGNTSIEGMLSNNCKKLTSVTLGSGVTSIDDYAFSGCTGLKSVIIPDSVKTIGNSVFSGCTGLESVIIPDSVETIGNSAFSGCTGLESVTIPDSVTSIGQMAFSSCTGLKSVTIPDGVETIGTMAFYYCTNLTSVTIPDSVTSIGSSAFNGCTSLTEMTIGSGITTIEYGLFSNLASLEHVTLGNSVTSIGQMAFYNCTSLTSVTIPDSVTSIGSSAFSGCKSLKSVTIPDSVETIESSAFSGCEGLKSVTIPDSVNSIDRMAFYSCTNLETVLLVGANDARKVQSMALKGNPNVLTLVDNEIKAFDKSNKPQTFNGGEISVIELLEDSEVTLDENGSTIISACRTTSGDKTTEVTYLDAVVDTELHITGASVTKTVGDEGVTITTDDGDGNTNTTEITLPEGTNSDKVTVDNAGTTTVPAGSKITGEDEDGTETETTYPDGTTIGRDGNVNPDGSDPTIEKDKETGDVTINDGKDNTTEVDVPDGGKADVKVGEDGNVTIEVPGGTTVTDGDTETTYPEDTVLGPDGKPVDPETTPSIEKDKETGDVTINDGKDGETKVEPPKDEDGNKTDDVTVDPDGTVHVPAGGKVDGEEWPFGGTIKPDGTTEKNSDPNAGSDSGNGSTPGSTGGNTDVADVAGADEGLTTIEAEAVPLAGPVSVADVLEELYKHEGSPDGEDPEGEYDLAVAWAITNKIIDEDYDVEELVTAAILRDILIKYIDFAGIEYTPSIDGEDDDIVDNCGEILTELFAADA